MRKEYFRQPYRLSWSSRRRDRSLCFSWGKGFSLFELLAVLVILAIGAAIVAPATGKMLAKISFRRDGLLLKKELRGLKTLAVSKGEMVRLRLEDESFVVRLGGGEDERRPWPMAPESQLLMTPEVVQFSPLGTATPATLILARDERQRTLRLDALTGLPY